MVREKAISKALKLVEEEGVFILSETPKYEYWRARGNAEDFYEIIYHKYSGEYTCTCKNIRLTPCSHVLAIKMIKGDLIDDKGNYMESVVPKRLDIREEPLYSYN